MARTVGIKDFDLWRPEYGGATVTVVRPGTTVPIPLYLNDDGTIRTGNPQTLLTLDRDGISYGRFKQPIYVAEDYSLIISTGGGETISRVPLSTFEGEDASGALIAVPGTVFPRALRERAAYEINVLDYGDLSASSAENSDLIDRAIGVAAAAGGGIVRLPRAAFDIQSITPVPSNVRLVGHGIGTTIMRASIGADIITLTGERSGIADFELDGQTLPANSVGVRLGPRVQQGVDPPMLEGGHIRDVMIRRFSKGIQASYGGAGFVARGCVITGNNIGVELDAVDGAVDDLLFSECRIGLNSSKGIVLHSSQTHRISDIQIRKSRIQNGPGLLEVEGALNTIVAATAFRGGASPGRGGRENLAVRDCPEDSTVSTDGLLFQACSFENIRQRFQGRCENLRYNNCRFTTNIWELHSPENNILLLDCDESPSDRVESSGAANLVRKDDSLSHINVNGRTTDATATTAWSYLLSPGECVYLEATATGRQINGTNVAAYRVSRGVYIGGATLTFDNGITAFQIGDLVANKTRYGLGRVIDKSGATAAGTLTVSAIEGSFENGDVIGTPDAGGIVPNSATVNGALSYPNECTVFSIDHSYTRETDPFWNGLAIVSNGPSVDVLLAGKAATNIDWTVNIKLTAI